MSCTICGDFPCSCVEVPMKELERLRAENVRTYDYNSELIVERDVLRGLLREARSFIISCDHNLKPIPSAVEMKKKIDEVLGTEETEPKANIDEALGEAPELPGGRRT